MATILVVEDDSEVRLTVTNMLRLLGYDPVAPSSGREALALIRGAAYDLVLTDILMPDVDGLEIIKAVRRERPLCPIVAMSGGSHRMPAKFSLTVSESLGADVTLQKPFRKTDLDEAVRAAFATRRH